MFPYLREDLKWEIVKALKREEAKLEKNVKHAFKRLAALKATMKFFGGTTPGTKLVYGKKRRMSAAARLAISKATKARWAKVRELSHGSQGAQAQDVGGWTSPNCEGTESSLGEDTSHKG